MSSEHAATAIGIGISTFGSSWAVLADVTNQVGVSDATLMAWAGTATAVLIPAAIKIYKMIKSAMSEAEVSEFQAYKTLLLEDLKALRVENAKLASQVSSLQVEVAGLRDQLTPKVG